MDGNAERNGGKACKACNASTKGMMPSIEMNIQAAQRGQARSNRTPCTYPIQSIRVVAESKNTEREGWTALCKEEEASGLINDNKSNGRSRWSAWATQKHP